MRKLLALLVCAPLVAAGCHHGFRSEVRGSGKRERQKREIGAFTSISAEGAFFIDVVCQKDPSLQIEGDDNVLPLVTTEVSGNVLRIRNSKSYSVNEPITLKLSVPNLEALSVNGAGKFQVTNVNNEKFEIDSNGAAMITVSGTTKVIDIDTNGAAKIDTHNLRASRGIVDSKGVSKVDLGVSDQLDVTVSGPSIVTYKGDPTVNKTIHGPGKVEKRADEGA
jgi:putative autotransporter adhesin-like protein